MTEDARRGPVDDGPDAGDGRSDAEGVWEFGFAASRVMVARVQALYDGLPSGPARGDIDADLRRLRIDLERAADVSLDLLDRFLALLRRFDRNDEPAAAHAGGEDLVVRVPAGGRGSAELWAHNVSDSTQSPPELRCSAIADFEGVCIPASSVRVECAPDPIDGRNSRRIELVVEAPHDTPQGSYHGLLLTRADSETSFRVRVDVT
jgi:hypothetical protein